MPRHRTVSDDTILEAALAFMGREGPGALTLAAVGRLVDLSAATLLQRFGTKEALLRAALERSWEALEEATAKADAQQPVTFEGAIGVIGALWPSAAAELDFVNGLLLLREDLRDPVLRARGVAWLESLALALGRRITSDPARHQRLGRLMVSQWQGTQIWWAFSREGAAVDVIANDLREWYRALDVPH